MAPTLETVRSCKIRETTDGVLPNVDTERPFTYADACVEHGPHLGYDPVATQSAKSSVVKLLKMVFRLE